MSHLNSFRQGWNHERFAKYILGKMSFISTPDTTGDDTGLDISGFFIRRHPTRPLQIIPYLPYTIQIKPKAETDFIQDHLRELAVLSVPFYYGKVNPHEFTLDVYSGAGLTVLLALRNAEELCTLVDVAKVIITCKFVDELKGLPVTVNDSRDRYDVIFYKVCTLCIDTGFDSKEVEDWAVDCDLSLQSIESCKSGEFIFRGKTVGVGQFVGIGTYTHALRRFMHSSSLLAEFVHSRRLNDMEAPPIELEPLMLALVNSTREVQQLYLNWTDIQLRNSVIAEHDWAGWLLNIEGVRDNYG